MRGTLFVPANGGFERETGRWCLGVDVKEVGGFGRGSGSEKAPVVGQVSLEAAGCQGSSSGLEVGELQQAM